MVDQLYIAGIVLLFTGASLARALITKAWRPLLPAMTPTQWAWHSYATVTAAKEPRAFRMIAYVHLGIMAFCAYVLIHALG